MMKPIKTLIIIFSICAFLALSATFAWLGFFNPRRGEIKDIKTTPDLYMTFSQKNAEEDLTYLYKKLINHHPLWLEKTDEAMLIQEKVKTIYENELVKFEQKAFENKSVTTLDIFVACSKLVASMNDGHTRVWTNCSSNKLIHDLTQFRQPETFGTLTAINSIPIETLFDNFCKIQSYETLAAAKNTFKTYPLYEESLLALGFDLTNGVDFTYTKEGVSKNFHYNIVPGKEIIDPNNKISTKNIESSNWVEYKIQNDMNLGIFTLRECTVNDEYLNALEDFFTQVADNNITNIVVDLRGNSGGNSWVANEFLRYIDIDEYNGWDCAVRYGPILYEFKNNVHKNRKVASPYKGKIYVFTDIYTYSSAMDFAMFISDNNLGKLIGEPSGNKPCSYGDCLYFQTPNAKIPISVSFKKWYRIDMSKNQDLLDVDYPCAPEDCFEELNKLL